MKSLNCLVYICCMLVSMPLYALRCGQYLVEPGDYKEDVLESCGDPDSVHTHYERRSNGNRAAISQYNLNGQIMIFPNDSFNYGQFHYQDVEVLVEEWVYDFGSSRLRKLLRFENGKLIDIISLSRRRYRRY